MHVADPFCSHVGRILVNRIRNSTCAALVAFYDISPPPHHRRWAIIRVFKGVRPCKVARRPWAVGASTELNLRRSAKFEPAFLAAPSMRYAKSKLGTRFLTPFSDAEQSRRGAPIDAHAGDYL